MRRTVVPGIVLALAVLVAGHGDESLATPIPSPPAATGPLDISAGVFLLDLVRVDAADQSVEADFIVHIAWRDSRLADNPAAAMDKDAIWRPQVLPVQGRKSLSIEWEDTSVDADGTVHLRRRYVGAVSAPLDLTAFPFDQHVIRLTFATPSVKVSDFRFSVDESHSGRSPSNTVADWSVVSSHVNVDPFRIPEVGVTLPAFGLEIGVKRHRGFYIWGVILPLVMIMAMSGAVYWLHTSYVTQKISIATTSILTLIAYRFALGTQVPRLSYLTRMDYFTMGATTLVFLAFLKTVIEAGLVHSGREARAKSIDRACRWGFPAALVVVLYFSFMS